MTERNYRSIRYEIEDGVGCITFDLPEFGNALDLHGVQETFDALQAAEADDSVGAVMFTGAGKTFCAGFNLKEIPADRGVPAIAGHFQVLAHGWHQIFHRMVRMKKPVLAAVNGAAAGSGLGLTLCADLAVCSERARFLCAWHSIGLANDATTSYTLAKIVGFRRAMELMMTNRTLSAEEAKAWQIVNRVYPDAELGERAREIARELAAGPTHLQGMAKESFHMGWRRSLEEATEFEIQNVMSSLRDPYFEDALRRFLAGESRSDGEIVHLPPGL